MLKNSASFASSSAMIAAAGTSIMMPSGTSSRALVSRLVDLGERAIEQLAHRAELLNRRDHRHHDHQLPVRRGAHHRAQLLEENVGTRQTEPHRAQAERGIHLRRRLERRAELVAADVEGAQRHRQRAHALEHARVGLILLLFARRQRAIDVQELGAVEADALSALGQRDLGLATAARCSRAA